VKVAVYTIHGGELRYLYERELEGIDFQDLLSKYGFIGIEVRELED